MNPEADKIESENTTGEDKVNVLLKFAEDEHVRLMKEKDEIIRKQDAHIERLEEQIDDHLKIIAQSSGPSAGTESSTDINTPDKIKAMFKDVYKGERKNLATALGTSRPEDMKIKIILDIVKTTHDVCVEFADNQICDFLCLERNISLENESKYTELYRVRSEVSQDESVVKRMTKKIVEEVVAKTEIEQENGQIKENRIQFVQKLATCFWISEVAKTKVQFDFDVEKGTEYNKRKFEAYSVQIDSAFKDDRYAPGTVHTLVWPCMFVRSGNEMVVRKGFVAEVFKKFSVEVNRDVTNMNDKEANQEYYDKSADSCIY